MSCKPLVAVLHGAMPANAPADEQDALIEAEAVAGALNALGVTPLLQPVTTNLDRLEQELLRLRPTRVFNLVEALDGCGAFIAWVPQLLDRLGIPYTGAGAEAQFLTSNKLMAKRWLAMAGIATPEWSEDGCGTESGVWIVKSVWEHASIGIDDQAIVCGGDAVKGCIARQRERFGGRWFAERFVGGRELNIALLEDGRGVRTLPVAEIDFSAFPEDKPRIVGYAAKWDESAFEYHNTPRRFLDPRGEARLSRALQRLGRSCWQLFGLRGYARVDVRIDDKGQAFVLDVNANPCLSPDAGFAAAAGEAGVGYARLIERILDCAQSPGVAADPPPLAFPAACS